MNESSFLNEEILHNTTDEASPLSHRFVDFYASVYFSPLHLIRWFGWPLPDCRWHTVPEGSCVDRHRTESGWSAMLFKGHRMCQLYFIWRNQMKEKHWIHGPKQQIQLIPIQFVCFFTFNLNFKKMLFTIWQL